MPDPTTATSGQSTDTRVVGEHWLRSAVRFSTSGSHMQSLPDFDSTAPLQRRSHTDPRYFSHHCEIDWPGSTRMLSDVVGSFASCWPSHGLRVPPYTAMNASTTSG